MLASTRPGPGRSLGPGAGLSPLALHSPPRQDSLSTCCVQPGFWARSVAASKTPSLPRVAAWRVRGKTMETCVGGTAGWPASRLIGILLTGRRGQEQETWSVGSVLELR